MYMKHLNLVSVMQFFIKSEDGDRARGFVDDTSKDKDAHVHMQ